MGRSTIDCMENPSPACHGTLLTVRMRLSLTGTMSIVFEVEEVR